MGRSLPNIEPSRLGGTGDIPKLETVKTRSEGIRHASTPSLSRRKKTTLLGNVNNVDDTGNAIHDAYNGECKTNDVMIKEYALDDLLFLLAVSVVHQH